MLTRPNIDKFKLDLEALRRASDHTPRQVFMTDACQRMLTRQLFASNQIAKSQAELWQAWDDRTFFEVLQEEFPSDKRRGNDKYQTAMSRFNDVQLVIDFYAANCELRYVEKIDAILHEIGGEEKFSR